MAALSRRCADPGAPPFSGRTGSKIGPILDRFSRWHPVGHPARRLRLEIIPRSRDLPLEPQMQPAARS
jgi:hypothetical protein